MLCGLRRRAEKGCMLYAVCVCARVCGVGPVLAGLGCGEWLGTVLSAHNRYCCYQTTSRNCVRASNGRLDTAARTMADKHAHTPYTHIPCDASVQGFCVLSLRCAKMMIIIERLGTVCSCLYCVQPHFQVCGARAHLRTRDTRASCADAQSNSILCKNTDRQSDRVGVESYTRYYLFAHVMCACALVKYVGVQRSNSRTRQAGQLKPARLCHTHTHIYSAKLRMQSACAACAVQFTCTLCAFSSVRRNEARVH